MWYNIKVPIKSLTKGDIFMPKGKPNKRYTGEFKQKVVETMRSEGLSYHETARQFDINDHKRVAAWERIYLEEGKEGLYVERRGRASSVSGTQKGRKPNFDKKVDEDLIGEIQRLRAENAYLKKLNALVAERVRQEKKHK
jgi:transposase-like protein